MGMTPYEGLMMGTRSGSVDPGILLHLLDHDVDAGELGDGLARRSGLAAVAGTSSAREIEASAAAGDPDAGLAVALFARRAAGAIAAAATSLSRLDAVVFTGGIGEHSALFRDAITDRLGPLGIASGGVAVDGDALLSAGPPAVLVVAAREDLVIAEEVTRLLG
jgi:acetate kinase